MPPPLRTPATDAVPVWSRPTVLLPVLAMLSLLAGAMPSFSLRETLLVGGVGGYLFGLGVSRALPRGPARDRLPAYALWWLAPLLVLAAVELTSLALGSTVAHPTLSGLADPVLARYAARSAAFFAWSAAFLAMARR